MKIILSPLHGLFSTLKRMLRRLIILLNIAALLICTTGQVAAQTKVTYFHNDLSGNPIAASDSTGQIIWRESYRPYGERQRNEAASQTNSQWYTGHRQDADTGLVYMGARHYDPLIGRFLSTDPAGFSEGNPSSFNRYAYATNNPLKYTDPDGRLSLVAVGGGLLLAGTVFYATTTKEQRDGIVDGFVALGRQFSNLLNATADNGTKQCPNPNGCKGKQDHQDKVEELKGVAEADAGDGERVEVGKKIKADGSSRMPDVQIVDSEEKTVRIYEAERRPNSKRNREREAEYERLNIPNQTYPLN